MAKDLGLTIEGSICTNRASENTKVNGAANVILSISHLICLASCNQTKKLQPCKCTIAESVNSGIGNHEKLQKHWIVRIKQRRKFVFLMQDSKEIMI